MAQTLFKWTAWKLEFNSDNKKKGWRVYRTRQISPSRVERESYLFGDDEGLARTFYWRKVNESN